eukprot:2413313-Rhodomonas_salina.1
MRTCRCANSCFQHPRDPSARQHVLVGRDLQACGTCVSERKTEREREREGGRKREREKETDRDRDRDKERHTDTHRHKEETHTHTDKQRHVGYVTCSSGEKACGSMPLYAGPSNASTCPPHVTSRIAYGHVTHRLWSRHVDLWTRHASPRVASWSRHASPMVMSRGLVVYGHGCLWSRAAGPMVTPRIPHGHVTHLLWSRHAWSRADAMGT